MNEKNKYKDVDNLLNKIFHVGSYSLNDLFEQRLAYLDITKHQALKILDIETKTIDSILNGDSKKIDFVTITKLSDFLLISQEEIIKSYFQLVEKTHNEDITTSKKRTFIVNNFNLPALKKLGLIESINDFDHIEKKINDFFGYDNIFEYNNHQITAAFSSSKRSTQNESLKFWYATACQSLEKTPNPYLYDREKLIAYFPQIRWHSMNEDNGLTIVAQQLFKLGITVIIVPKYYKDLHIRGATLPYRNKPCIVLTKATDFYATLWFTLIHELHHVLYDWDEIWAENYHISGESGETNTPNISEEEADEFARQYLFSDEKMKAIKPHINEHFFVKKFAEQNHVHFSIVYSNYCWDVKDSYGKFYKYMAINFDKLLQSFHYNDFLKFQPLKQISTERNMAINLI